MSDDPLSSTHKMMPKNEDLEIAHNVVHEFIYSNMRSCQKHLIFNMFSFIIQSLPFHWPQVRCRSTWIRVMPSTCRRSDDESCTKIPCLFFSIDRSDVVDNCNIYHIYLLDDDSLYSLYTWGSLVCGSHFRAFVLS